MKTHVTSLEPKPKFDFDYWVCKCGYVKSDTEVKYERFLYPCFRCKRIDEFHFKKGRNDNATTHS